MWMPPLHHHSSHAACLRISSSTHPSTCLPHSPTPPGHLPAPQDFTVFTGRTMEGVRAAYARGERSWCGLPHLLHDSPNCTVAIPPHGPTFVAVAKPPRSWLGECACCCACMAGGACGAQLGWDACPLAPANPPALRSLACCRRRRGCGLQPAAHRGAVLAAPAGRAAGGFPVLACGRAGRVNSLQARAANAGLCCQHACSSSRCAMLGRALALQTLLRCRRCCTLAG